MLSGEVARLPELAPDLLYISLLPYLGRSAAAAERRKLLRSLARRELSRAG